MTSPPPTIGVLFVCLGNICRSPLAKGLFMHLARERSLRERFQIDSCGTGAWHSGDNADPRTLLVARKNGIELQHQARQVAPLHDFQRFEYLLAMDRRNQRDLLGLGAPCDRVFLMRSFDPALAEAPEDELDVPDPYYGGADGFDRMYTMLHAACDGLLTRLHAEMRR